MARTARRGGAAAAKAAGAGARRGAASGAGPPPARPRRRPPDPCACRPARQIPQPALQRRRQLPPARVLLRARDARAAHARGQAVRAAGAAGVAVGGGRAHELQPVRAAGARRSAPALRPAGALRCPADCLPRQAAPRPGERAGAALVCCVRPASLRRAAERPARLLRSRLTLHAQRPAARAPGSRPRGRAARPRNPPPCPAPA